MHPYNLHPFSSLDSCMSEIASRWEKLESGIPLACFLAYVRACQPMPCRCAMERSIMVKSRTICRQAAGANKCEEYRPSYPLPHQPTSWKRYQKACRLQQLEILELAAAHCFAAKVMVPKPTRQLLDTAKNYCVLFDKKMDELERITKGCRDACVKGGKVRQSRLNPAREYARRLYARMRPPEGWKNTTTAVRVIQPQVLAFVARCRLPVLAGSEQDTIRSIRKWLMKETESNSDAA